MNVTVIYYSRTGITEKVAGQIGHLLNAGHVESLKATREYSGFSGYMRGGYEGVSGKSCTILNEFEKSFFGDIVIVGTPVWAGNIAGPVRGFIEKYRDSIEKAAVFCTSGGGNCRHAIDEFKNVLGKSPGAALGLGKRDLKSDEYQSMIASFADRIKASV